MNSIVSIIFMLDIIASFEACDPSRVKMYKQGSGLHSSKI